ncbi:hypothetical protein [Halorubrum sp. 48-1-W]|nr:hypothetical protein [Halorubrum sp. 48-1-W]
MIRSLETGRRRPGDHPTEGETTGRLGGDATVPRRRRVVGVS